MSKSKEPVEVPVEKKPEIERGPDDPGDRHEPEITDVPRPENPELDNPVPDKPEIETPL